jgi:hypothetical protein
MDKTKQVKLSSLKGRISLENEIKKEISLHSLNDKGKTQSKDSMIVVFFNQRLCL